MKELGRKLTTHTIAGGDWNCVPDVTLDVQSSNPLRYQNTGARVLSQSMRSKGLVDERREQLGNIAEYTRFEATPVHGTITATRLDRFYIPSHKDFEDYQWNFEVTNEFIFKPTNSDHYGVILEMDPCTGELGHDRRTIREDLVKDREIQVKMIVPNVVTRPPAAHPAE